MMKPEQLQAFLCLQRDAEAGDGAAACRLGDMYREGLGGLRYSPRQTYHWYARSAMAGDANGQNNLGACYEHALGCAQSYVKAAKWYRLAAAQELSTAFMNLGYCYLHGHGVPRDKVEALRLFQLAVEGGEDRAQQEVERLESDRDLWVPQPVPADTQRARPCVLARRVPRRDGPLKRLQQAGAATVTNEFSRRVVERLDWLWVRPLRYCSEGPSRGRTAESEPPRMDPRRVRGSRYREGGAIHTTSLPRRAATAISTRVPALNSR
jgi:hypothetical protein